MSIDITPAESVAPVFLVDAPQDGFELPNLTEAAVQRESALGKLRLLGLTDEEIAAILPQ